MNIDGLENVNESLSTHYLIYKITNNVNGKYYIGQHQTDDYLDDYAGSGVFIKRAEDKYGLSSFTKTILYDFDNFNDMNNKEIELVQLSNCYPYDPMSYNIAIGGNGFNMTPECNQRKGRTISENYWNMPEEKRLEYKEECKRRARVREQHITKEDREKAKQTQRNTWANKSEEEIQAGVTKWRKSMERHTAEQRAEITRKRLESLATRSVEEKETTRQKFKQTIENRSSERKAEIGKKRSEALKASYKEHPERAKRHSEMMSGQNNPQYGKRWMNNGKNRILVKPEDFQTYIELGYIFAFRI